MKNRISVHEFILVAFVAAIALLMWLLYRHELELQRNDLRRDISVAEQIMSQQIEADQAFIEQIAREKAEGALSREQFETRVSQRALLSPHIAQVLWITPHLTPTWSAPGTLSQQEVARIRAPLAEQDRLMRITDTTSRATYSEPYAASNGRSYIEFAAPLNAGGNSLGAIFAVVSITQFARTLLPDWFLSKYQVAITDVAGRVVSSGETSFDEGSYLTESQLLSLPWKSLHLKVTARKRGSALAGVTISTMILLLTSLIAWSFYSLRKEAERRAANERTIKAVNERFETVLDSLDVAVYVSDANSAELLFANDNFKASFENFDQTAVGSFEAQFLPMTGSLFSMDTQDFDTVVKGEILHKPSGRWFITRVRRVRWVDGRDACLHTMGDVTDRVESDRVKRSQQERLMLTSRLLTAGEMASTLAHEINQPLAAINNYVKGSLQRLRSGSNDYSAIEAAMEKASTQAQRAGAIINRVREFVRTRDPQREALSVVDLIDDVKRFSDPDPTKVSVHFRTEIGTALPTVFADRIMIEQVLLNLIRNAKEAMADLPDAQKIVVIRAVQLAPDHVTLSIADAGCGVAPDVLAGLFSPFMTTKSHGMGMGLSICRSIIEYHEGQMRHIANAPQGAIFEFTLPIADHG